MDNEKYLSKWRYDYKQRNKHKYESVNEILKNCGITDITEFFFEFQRFQDDRTTEQKYIDNAHNLIEFYNKHGHLPKRNGILDNEKYLGEWRDSYKNSSKCKHESVNEILKNCGITDIIKYFFGTTIQNTKELPPESSSMGEKRGREQQQESSETESSDSEEENSQPAPKQPKKTCSNHEYDFDHPEHLEDGRIRINCMIPGCRSFKIISTTPNELGYSESNPDKKREINEWLPKQIYLPGKAVLLDADGLKSSKPLLYAGKFTAENIIIPEKCNNTYTTNRQDLELGSSLVCGDFLEELKKIDPEDLSLIYADFTGHFDKFVRPLLDYLDNKKIRPGTILGITWCINGKKSQDEIDANTDALGYFRGNNKWNRLSSKDSPSQTGYDKKKNMNVVFFRKN